MRTWNSRCTAALASPLVLEETDLNSGYRLSVGAISTFAEVDKEILLGDVCIHSIEIENLIYPEHDYLNLGFSTDQIIQKHTRSQKFSKWKVWKSCNPVWFSLNLGQKYFSSKRKLWKFSIENSFSYIKSFFLNIVTLENQVLYFTQGVCFLLFLLWE